MSRLKEPASLLAIVDWTKSHSEYVVIKFARIVIGDSVLYLIAMSYYKIITYMYSKFWLDCMQIHIKM